MDKLRQLFVYAVITVLSLVCVQVALAQQARPKVMVFAAASLKSVLDDVAAQYEAADVIISAAGSSALARQIEFGAPADVYISAHPQWVAYLAKRDFIDRDTAVPVASNALSVIAPAASSASGAWQDQIGQGRLALAHTQAVPAGVYARAALEHFELWERAAPTVVQTDHVRAALALVARGEVPLGIVYATDVRAAQVRVLTQLPAESHPSISYVAAPLRSVAQFDAAQEFVTYLASGAGQEHFQNHGFLPPRSDLQAMQ